jgi:inorganic pyrophosphatase
MQSAFWTHLETLIHASELVIDRPKGSIHPRDDAVMYPLDYGYLKGTSSGDGDGIDVWRGSLPDGRFDAVVCTIDLDKRDAEIKLLLGCTADEKQVICAFHTGLSAAAILIDRTSRRQDDDGGKHGS